MGYLKIEMQMENFWHKMTDAIPLDVFFHCSVNLSMKYESEGNLQHPIGDNGNIKRVIYHAIQFL